eukprot:4295366-Pleurochrysis_carterae.AAC.1
MLRMCCAQSPKYHTLVLLPPAPQLPSRSILPGYVACCTAASTTAASRRSVVARAALHMSLIFTSDPASRSSASALGCGSVHAAEAPAAVSSFNYLVEPARQQLPRRLKTFTSTAFNTRYAVPRLQ